VGLAIAGLPIALIAAVPNTATALILFALAGVGTTIVDVAGLTLLQRVVPDEVLTRVMGIAQSVFVGTLGLGAVIVPALIAGLGNRGALAATGAGLPLLAVVSARRLRHLDESAAAPPPRLDLLRAIPLFRPLAPATLEQLARELRPLQIPAGEEIVRQGDRGDLFYILAEGEVEVRIDGREVEPLRAGSFFGEIALLRDVPRTATISARSDVDLLALDRDHFIAAVTGHPESEEAARAVIASRLGPTATAVSA
jgi:MFS family permease